VILFLTHADTEILALRVLSEGLPPGFPPVRAANPSRLGGPPPLAGARLVVVRLLGGRRAWQPHFESLRSACAAASVPLLAFGGEAWADPEMAAASSVDPQLWAAAFDYLAEAGTENLEQLLRFLADRLLGTAFGYRPPRRLPEAGPFPPGPPGPLSAGAPRVGVVFYRAHVLAGNTQFVDDLCAALRRAGAEPVPAYCYSLRPGPGSGSAEALGLLRRSGVGSLVTTVLAAGSASPDGQGWEAPELAGLGVPVVQAVCATGPSRDWVHSSFGLGPLDVAMGVALPELDGRIIGPAFSFKERVDDGEALGAEVTAYRTLDDRADRVAGLAARLARLDSVPVAQRRVCVVLSAYPTKRSRLANAVGLDTPASALALLEAMRRAGYRVAGLPGSGDELMAQLAARLTYEEPRPDPARAALAVGRWPEDAYRACFERLDPQLKEQVTRAWGPPPGQVGVVPAPGGRSELVFCGLDLGNVLVAVQPPRGFGHDPVALYHSPDLPPTHHYLAFYRWLDEVWGAHAIVHLGKHGTLEWLPGKSVGLSAACAPDAVLGDLPLVYPFVVNDPGEGTQAKRRAHAVIVDHLVPPLTRADTYDELARLESLLDAHAELSALDPAKLPALRRQIWELVVEAEIHRDLGLELPEGGEGTEALDSVLSQVDGYLCELKDAQIRGGLHVLGQAPEGPAELDMVAALTRLPQGSVPSLRATVAAELGLSLDSGRRRDLDRVEEECRSRLARLQEAGWNYQGDDPTLAWVCDRLVPALRRTGRELEAVLEALSGRHVEPGPAGSPSRGMAHVLPTGRNFYSLDPRSVPSPLAWEVGQGLARSLLERFRRAHGRWPRSVGMVVWGTSTMRTGGDDVAEALALLGVRPRWAEESGRVVGLEAVPSAELGRPRIDVTLRVSGFFRDAFPHVIELLDQAVALVASLDEPEEANYVRAAGDDPRLFGPKPGAYGCGVLSLIESGSWSGPEDLASVYLAWGGYCYGRGRAGEPAPEAMRRRFSAIEVALKNQDNREHDIFDSDDYLQEHGGMVAAVTALRGSAPEALFGDSSDPSRPRVRSLAEEAARVVRSRVLNPKWIGAMAGHGYKGAFEMAATVDYLFGYDATTGVVEDWMYERVAAAYVADPELRKFFEQSNPWALASIAGRLLEAAERGMWRASAQALDGLRAAVLEAEGWMEDRG
jgi:cobaltochelatase CobN